MPIAADALETLLEDNSRCSPGAWRAWLESGSLETLELDSLDIPALLIAGEHDPVIPLELLRSEIAPLLTEPGVEIIAGAGHLLPLEAAERVAELIAAHAAGISGT